MMQEWIESLKMVQDKDLRIARLQSQIDAVPAEKENARRTIAEAELAVGAAKAGLQDVEKAIKHFQIEVDSIEAKRRDFESKSLMIRDNNEYKVAMHQIDGCKEQVRKLEDQELVLMEQLETARDRLAAEKKRTEAVTRRTEQLVEDLDKRLAACEAQKLKLEEQRNELLKSVPADIASMYQRLLISRLRAGREPVGFAPIAEYNCSCCHMTIPPQVRMNAMKGQKVNCPQCSVLLYVEE